MRPPDDLLRRATELRKEYFEASKVHWIHNEINTGAWWLSVLLTIVPWIVWYRIVDRKRVLEILLFGFFVLSISGFLDVMGSEIVLWDYPIRVLPFIPRLMPIDAAVMPVGYMIVYQYFPKWKSFLTASIGLALFYTFVGEPLMVWLSLYRLHSWRYIYSLPIYLIIAIISKALVSLLEKRQNQKS